MSASTWLCTNGIRASDNLTSSPSTTVPAIEPKSKLNPLFLTKASSFNTKALSTSNCVYLSRFVMSASTWVWTVSDLPSNSDCKSV